MSSSLCQKRYVKSFAENENERNVMREEINYFP